MTTIKVTKNDLLV